ncbi:MAG: ATP synthase F1 subunit gamma [Acholeplasmataceae bacterium]
MALKDIKLRMQAIKKTSSITQAMHNIALSKIKKSTQTLKHSEAFVGELSRILEDANQQLYQHRLTTPSEVKRRLYILVTSDRGLCGSYHNQLFKAFLKEVEPLKTSDYEVFVLGKKGYYFALKRGIPTINKEIIYNRDDIFTMYFRGYASIIKDAFMDEMVDQVILFHNHYINTASTEVARHQILPLDFESKGYKENYFYDAPAEVVLDQTVSVYVEGRIFQALADGKLSEHAQRMVAMKNATDNAKDIVEKLNTVYHRARQQEITSELIDVVNGSNV